jgi:hypothetical protein
MIHRLIATILTGLLLAIGFSMIGCKPTAPGPTQTPSPTVAVDVFLRCTPCGDEWDCQLHDSLGNTHGQPFCGRSGQTWARYCSAMIGESHDLDRVHRSGLGIHIRD